MCNNFLDWFQACAGVPTRLLLGIMAFFGLMTTQMIRSNLYISIVGMVKDRTQDGKNSSMEHYQGFNITPSTNETEIIDGIERELLDWDEGTQGLLFSAFYWCYWLSELPGGIMAQRWGGRRVLGISVMIAGLLNAFVPLACKFHYLMVAGLRAVQGLALGVTWPAVHALAGCWIPAGERSKFMTVYHGAAIGNAVTYPMCGFLLENYGWESTFYVTAAINLLWVIGCWLFIYDSPADHPRIATREKKYLRRQLLAKSKSNNKRSIPWLQICTSSRCWAVFAASQGVMWCTITLSMQLPTFLSKILEFGSQETGIFSGIPEFSKFGFGICFSSLMDYLLHQKHLSITAVRKISVAACEYIPAILLLAIFFFDVTKDATTTVILFILTSAFGGASSSGSLANIVDLSPNYAGVILGLIKTVSMVPGVLSPLVAGYITSKDDTEFGWKMIFALTAIINIVCCTLFLLFGSGEVQPWNEDNKLKESIPLELANKPSEESAENLDSKSESDAV